MTIENTEKATIDDVARHAGVSTATVSRVINKSGKVRPETEITVRAAIEKLGYQPNAAARSLSSKRTRTLGLLIDQISGEYFSPMLRGIEIATERAGYAFVISTGTKHQLVGESNTDGLVIFANSMPDDEMLRLHERGFPIVLLHRSSPHFPHVTIENKRGAAEMMDYLINIRKYRKFAFLRGEEAHEDTIWREKGYQIALERAGLDYDQQIIGQGDFNEQKSYQTVIQWIRQGLEMDVIVAFDDDSAIGAMAALKDVKKRVPDDIAVVGFDDIRLASYLNPPLTTVRVETGLVAQTAVERLIELIETGKTQHETLLPTGLIVRQSCGCY